LRDNGPDQACGLFSWPPRLSETTLYLQQSTVSDNFHATLANKKWTECDHTVASRLEFDDSLPPYLLFPSLLERLQITLFSGNKDLICNWMGTQALVDDLEWGGAKGMETSIHVPWVVNNAQMGTVQSSKNLTFVVVFDASHMVAVDQPNATRDMLRRSIGLASWSELQSEKPQSMIPSNDQENSNWGIDTLRKYIIVAFIFSMIAIIGFLYMKRGIRLRR
ncbi:Cell death protease, partial [Nowakowskiella sp. JEL0078]